MSALAIVAAGIGVTGLAASQGTTAKPKASASAKTSGKPAAVDFNAPPPPNFNPKPPGVNAVLNEKGPGLPVLFATSPWPATLLGSAPIAAPSTPTTATTAAPNAPTGDQATALAQLEAAAKDYRVGASAYSKAIGQIIRQRYEQKRKARLSQLQENIDKDMVELKKARLDTMERLKAFLAKYPDVPEHTPNAMFRLAALYEEQAVDSDVDPADPDYTNKLRAAYEPAERLYRDIVARFPKYSQRASVHFFLGALLSDTGRGPESLYVWRALVCSNHFEFPVPPAASPAEEKAREKWKDGIPPGPQDHDMAFWDKWRETHYTIPDPKAKKKPAPAKKPGAAPTVANANEDEYVNPYPDDCVPLGGATTATGEEPQFVSQAWWRIGEYHYSRGDDSAEEEGYFGASPYRLNRALTSYEHAIKTSNETVKVFAMYKIAWTLYKQQRYSGARQKFLELLNYFDEKEKSGGQSGDAQMRQDAYDYTAASLTYLDMEGPGANEPFIERDDIFGQFSGKALETKLEVALDRVQDPKLVPQDKAWTPKIYKALAAEFESDEVQLDAIETYELILKKWDCDSEAPKFQKTIADLYDLLAIKAEIPADKEMYSGKALEARTKLLNYVGNTKWTECNKNNPDAIRTAESLMNEGVKNAAGRHTQLGRVYMSQASADPEGSPKQKNDLQHARDEYLLADRGWSAYLNQDPDAADAYESKFFIADARHKVVFATKLLEEKLDAKKVDEARAAAVEVRDSNLDDKYLRYAAYFAVDVVDMLAQEGFDAYMKSGCQAGTGIEVVESPLDEPQDACRPDGEKESRDEKTQ
ncbi:MAG: hypothetical protein ABI175_29090, partial [Polyangiales bacterium]